MKRCICRLWGFLLDHNPFYLLSALFMLVGCYVLGRALTLEPGHLNNVLILLGTLNVYEGLLIALSLFLILRRGMVRDGRSLLIIETIFLADFTLLGIECLTADISAGTVINLVLLALAAGKVGLMIYALKLRYAARTMAFMGAQFAVLFGTPTLFAWMTRLGDIPALAVYGMWWVVGLMVILRGLIIEPELDSIKRTFRNALTVIPLVSILVHLIAIGWLYHVPFYAANLSPLVLALGICCMRAIPSWDSRPWLIRLQIAFPAIAVILSLGFPDELTAAIAWLLNLQFSPLRVTLVGASMTCLYGFRLWPRALFALASAGCLLGAGAGYSLPTISATLADLRYQSVESMRKLIPKTAVQWGITSVVSAFAFLGLGAVVSLSKRAQEGKDT